MNTVLGVFLLIMNGQIVGAKAIGAYPTMQACHEAVAAHIKKQVDAAGPPPKGVALADMCTDLADDLGGAPHVKT